MKDAVASGAIEHTWDWDAEETHKWVEGMWRRTDDLTLAGPRAFRAHVGATGSLTRDALRRVGRYGDDPASR